MFGGKNYEHVQVTKIRWLGGTELRMSLDEAFVKKVPKPSLPYMSHKARAAFRDVVEYVQPVSNGCMNDILLFAEARGYHAHPADWIPTFKGDNQFPAIYQTMVNWLAENGHIPFFEGVILTKANFDFFSQRVRIQAFKNMLRQDRLAAYDFLLSIGPEKSAQARYDLLNEIDAGAGFYGVYPSDIPILKQFLNDRSKKIRALAEKKLETTCHLATEGDHAKAISHHFSIDEDGDLSISPDFPDANLGRHCWSTNLDALAEELGVSSSYLVSNVSLEDFRGNVFTLFPRTSDTEAKKVLAKRLATAGLECPVSLIRYIPSEDWEKALYVTFKSEYPSTVFDFLGKKAGTLDISRVKQIKHYSRMVDSVTEELRSGKLPTNQSYDPLRNLALVASKEAAEALLQEALSAGMSEKNPRLTMLKLNTAL
jgi:hypothetical protein